MRLYETPKSLQVPLEPLYIIDKFDLVANVGRLSACAIFVFQRTEKKPHNPSSGCVVTGYYEIPLKIVKYFISKTATWSGEWLDPRAAGPRLDEGRFRSA